jgi:hypothetical protein
MDGLTVTIPPPLAQRLREQKVADEKISETAVAALSELVSQPSVPARAPKETTEEYFRRIILEMRGGVPPSPDEPFVDGMTQGQYLALRRRGKGIVGQMGP